MPPGQQHEGLPEEPQAPPPPVIGIIYPPPEVRNIVDKTASFVARNGPEFEARIRQNELGNPKFNFLNSGDPYHAYYQHKVKEIREGKGDSIGPAPVAAVQRPGLAPATAARQQELLKAAAPLEPPPPRDPPPDFEFIADPPSISALELDIVKLTAQFVARNGRQFLTDLMKKEERNHQFDFLRPQHSLFQYFTRLLEQYTKVLLPPKELVSKLGAEIRSGVLEQARSRAAWHSHQARRKAADEAKIEKERLAYASIDWHDFVVVETVDYPAGEPGDFPPPTTPLEVGARVLAQERGDDIIQPNEEDDTEMQLESESESESDEDLAEMEDRTHQQQRPDDNRVQDMEEESSSDDDGPPEARAGEEAPMPPRPDRVVVKKYDPKRARPQPAPASEEWLVSPITGEKIPANKVTDHVRIGLLDPRWLEQRDRAAAERSDRDEALAPGAAIEASLKQLAERRTDIFGVGDEETAIGKKIGEEEKRRDERVTWDGHTSSVEAATRAARAHITLEDQIQQIHKVKGLLPDEEKEKIGPKPVPPGRVGVAIRPPPPPAQPRVQPPAAPAPAPVLLQPIPPLMVIPPMAPRPPLIATQVATPYGYPVPGVPAVPGVPGVQDDEEPTAKRPRTEDALEPEQAWLASHPGSVPIQVSVPMAPERSEWRLDGRTLSLSLPLAAPVSELKASLQRTTNMPTAKQKLYYEGLFFKDTNTLAYYNVPPGAVIQLQIKERGGRKK
ncbi:putative spliceosome associated protein [Danaus plexippus plexippus]|uniref:Spliceosome associated protein n=1 Tax=Danaus plexippus plexippus TaxID=278856 RepID=A0A212EM12_DANPL|nr:putative spliceosome associated protein [Danaus plexippus plexippus]